MRRNLRFLPALVLGAMITLSACADYAERVPYIPPTALSPAVQATVGARLGADANATWQAYTYSGTATAYAATRVVERVTEEAQAAATARQAAYQAQVAAVQLRSTEQALSLAARQTEVSLTAEQTRESVIVQATAQAARQKSEIVATANALEAQRQSIQRESEAAVVARQRQWNELYPWLIVTAAIVGVVAALVALAQWWRRNTPVRTMTEGAAMLITDARHYAVAAPPMLSANPPEREQLALPVPRVTVLPQPIELPSIEEGHVMVVGPTRSGKTTALRALLKPRGSVTVLDPHATPGSWGNATVVGAGGNFAAIDEYMLWMAQELRRRMEERARGNLQFDPLTVATDEMPAIADEVEGDTYKVWRAWLKQGWKFGLFFVLSTQSTRVKTLGIEGEADVLNNVPNILYLEDAAREAYPALTRGMERAVVLRTREGSRPVVVPYDPREDPESPLFTRRTNGHTPLFIAPTPLGVDTEGGFVPQQEVDRILALERQGLSRRKITAEMYGTEGGPPYQRVKGVLDKLVGVLAEDEGQSYAA